MPDPAVDPVNHLRRRNNRWVTVFVIVWLLIFHYESTRYFYLEPFFKRPLPQMRFLFPPAGWIMFFNVDEVYAGAEVYGLKNGSMQLIDPHDILKTKAIGYDNIHRNVLSTVLDRYDQAAFCSFLKRKFPDFDSFMITAVYYPSVIKTPDKKFYRPAYQCQ